MFIFETCGSKVVHHMIFKFY